jgi:hypothetical protein
LSVSLSSSIIHSLDSLPYNAVALNSLGVVVFTNSKWNIYSQEYGLSPHKKWVGAFYCNLMQDLIIVPHQWTTLYESVEYILHGEKLIYSAEFSIHTANKGNRIFRLDSFPLISDPISSEPTFVISLFDMGPFIEGPQVQENRKICTTCQPLVELIPICASCKSIRNTQEEWLSIEHFLKHQLSLQFTHDICPDCIKQLYPQYARVFKN